MTRAPVLLLLAVLGCSRTTSVGPAPETPNVGEPRASSTVLVGTYTLAVSSRRENSCSQSFEATSEFAKYELTIRDDGAATLAVSTHESSVFGPSGSKFTGGVNKQQAAASFAYAGRATAEGEATRVEVVDSKTSYKTSYKAFLSCKSATVDVAGGASVDGGFARIDAIACRGLPMLPDEATAHFKGAAPLAEGRGLFFSAEDFGHGSKYTRLARGL